MILALALLAVAGPSVADAERAFAAQAQAGPQWAAFRATAAPDAIVYAPNPVSAQAYFARLPEPAAKLGWRPAHTITACDGTLAYSTGPWSAGGRSGGFGTIWRRSAAGWRWIYDNGHDGAAFAGAADGRVIEEQAACPGPIGSVGEIRDIAESAPVPIAALRSGALAGLIEASDGPMPLAIRISTETAQGASADRTLRWRINPIAGAATGAHLLRVWSWDGRRYRLAVLDVSGTGASAK